jgi:hypothetical protein
MSCAPSIGNGGAGAQAHASELLDQDREQGALSSAPAASMTIPSGGSAATIGATR